MGDLVNKRFVLKLGHENQVIRILEDTMMGRKFDYSQKLNGGELGVQEYKDLELDDEFFNPIKLEYRGVPPHVREFLAFKTVGEDEILISTSSWKWPIRVNMMDVERDVITITNGERDWHQFQLHD